jgi:photosystem II stability/assembly factor-like uncharacterized protein
MLKQFALGISCAIFIATSFFWIEKESSTHRKVNHEKGEALEALRLFNETRAYPFQDIPEDAFGKAYEFYKENFIYQNKQTRASWEVLGPVGQGGRTISFAIDPNDTSKLWIGSASGGLWKSSTGGLGSTAWTYVNTSFPILGVGSIAINPNNSNEIFIGTGETYDYGTSLNGFIVRTTRGSNGIGILKSTDGGVTWSQSLNWLYNQRRGVWRIVYNPLNPNTIFAATTEGVLKSIDQGNTWTNVLNKTMVMDLDIDPSDTTILYASVGNLSSTDKGIYKTNNAGNTWSILTNGLPINNHSGKINVSIYKNNSSILMATVFNEFSTVGVYRSVNKGNSWTAVNTNSTEIASYQGWFCEGLLMKDTDSSKVLTGGVDLFFSNDKGNNFFELLPPDPIWSDIHGIFSNPLDPDKIYVLTDIGMYRSNNFGSTFYECLENYTVGQIYKGSVSATDSNIILIGMQDHNTFRYFTNPKDWQAVLGGDGSFNAISPLDDQIQYASYQYLNIFKSFDQGISFSPIYNNPASPSLPNTAAFIAPFILSPSNPQIIYAGSNELIVSTDEGNSWASIGPSPIDNGNKILSIAIAGISSDTVYCTTAPEFGPMHIFRSIDGGISQTDISVGLPNRYPRDIEVNPKNGKEVYIAFSGFGAGHLFKSLDAGATWTDISTTLPDIPFHSVLVDPLSPNVIFAGSDLGVFTSTDTGLTWTAMTGLPEATMVFDMVYSASDRALLAFTHGHGAYRQKLPKVPNTNVSIKHINNLEKTFSIYPNPAIHSAQVTFDLKQAAQVSISMYSMQGKLLFEQKNINALRGKNTIPLSWNILPKGNVIVKLESKEGNASKIILIE